MNSPKLRSSLDPRQVAKSLCRMASERRESSSPQTRNDTPIEADVGAFFSFSSIYYFLGFPLKDLAIWIGNYLTVGLLKFYRLLQLSKDQ